MNPVIQAQLREYVQANSLELYSQDQQFEVYSIFSILNGLQGETIDAYNVHLNGNEFGIDGIAILIQGELVKDRHEAKEKIASINSPTIEFIFFQSKTSTGYDYGDISKFFDAISEFFDGSLKNESAAIADLIGVKEEVYETGVGKRNPKLSCYYATTGNYESPDRIEKLRSGFIKQLLEKNIFDTKTMSIQIVGARDLQQWYRAATSSVEVEIEFPRNVVMPINEHVEEAYLGFVDAKNLLKLYTTTNSEDHSLAVNRTVFFDNIRDYDATSKINIAIKDSVHSDGGKEFVFRNNGITVVSKNIDRTGDKFRLEDFQIVNGCQTCNVIFDLVYGDETGTGTNQLLAETIQVPFRLIGSKDDSFVSSIIVGTNSQNPVREEQFWALLPFMKSLEEFCRSLETEQIIYIERRENQYRSLPKIERTRIMQPSVLMKAVAACLLFQPQRAARDYRGIVSEYEKAIFLDDHDVRIYHAVAYLYYRLEFLWRNQRIDSASKTFRYYILAGIGLQITDGNNTFAMKKKNRDAIASKVVELCGDEKLLKKEISAIVKIVDDQLKKLGASSQERVRDTIRSESFFLVFKKELQKYKKMPL
jgi:hypothetical protein